MRREPREIWVQRVERWRDSDLTAREFAAELGVNLKTLQAWKYRLAAEAREAKGEQRAPRKHTEQRTPAALSFVELPVSSAGDARFELEIRGVRVFVPPSFDADALKQLITIVGAAA